MAEPTSALDAIVTECQTKGGVEFKPLTLGRYALLELAKSPFVGGADWTVYNLLPSMYIMTEDFSSLSGYSSRNIADLEKAALAKFESFGVDSLHGFTEYMIGQLDLMNKVSPDSKGDAPGEATVG